MKKTDKLGAKMLITLSLEKLEANSFTIKIVSKTMEKSSGKVNEMITLKDRSPGIMQT
jgi:hypothetical protein